MKAVCTSCHKVIEDLDKIRDVRCPNCNAWQSLIRITVEQMNALPKSARLKRDGNEKTTSTLREEKISRPRAGDRGTAAN